MVTVETGSVNGSWCQQSRPDCMREKVDDQQTVKLQSEDTAGVGGRRGRGRCRRGSVKVAGLELLFYWRPQR